MMNRLPKARESATGYGRANSLIDYRYINYNIEQVDSDYYKCKNKLDCAQIQLDLINSTLRFSVDDAVIE